MNCNSVAIVGAGPAGCIAAYFAMKQGASVTMFEAKSPLHTLLYTGGGRCNLAHAEFDFRELAKNYPRGEKFLYSVFSQFSTADTLDFFEKIWVETYTQDDMRIFPTSNSAKDVRQKMLDSIRGAKIIKEKVIEVDNYGQFIVRTDKSSYTFDKVLITVGGHAGFKLAQDLGHTIVKPIPALTGLTTKRKYNELQGVSLKNVGIEAFFQGKCLAQATGDFIFTHEGVSGPLIYTVSSLVAREEFSKQFPIVLKLDFLCQDLDFQSILNINSKKDVKNILCEYIPKSLIEYILHDIGISLDTKCHQIDGKTRDLIYKNLREFELEVVARAKDGEVVTSGGVSLDEIDSKAMQSKLLEGLYFAGEVIDVDGFCGGFNLQNCWSTGYIAGVSV